jgi:type II secretory pathway component PulM
MTEQELKADLKAGAARVRRILAALGVAAVLLVGAHVHIGSDAHAATATAKATRPRLSLNEKMCEAAALDITAAMKTTHTDEESEWESWDAACLNKR